jgi:hypothetical protein
MLQHAIFAIVPKLLLWTRATAAAPFSARAMKVIAFVTACFREAFRQPSTRCVPRGLLAFAAACSLTTLPSCSPQTAPGAEARPVTEREDLARRLKLSADRFGMIKTGEEALGSGVLAFDADKDCRGGWCTCTGDEDCNEMFSGVCADPSTGGICQIRGDEPKCRCKDPRA